MRGSTIISYAVMAQVITHVGEPPTPSVELTETDMKRTVTVEDDSDDDDIRSDEEGAPPPLPTTTRARSAVIRAAQQKAAAGNRKRKCMLLAHSQCSAMLLFFAHTIAFVVNLALVSPEPASARITAFLMRSTSLVPLYEPYTWLLFPSNVQWMMAFIHLITLVYYFMVSTVFWYDYHQCMRSRNYNPGFVVLMMILTPVLLSTGFVFIGFVDLFCLASMSSLTFSGWCLMWWHMTTNYVRSFAVSGAVPEMEGTLHTPHEQYDPHSETEIGLPKEVDDSILLHQTSEFHCTIALPVAVCSVLFPSMYMAAAILFAHKMDPTNDTWRFAMAAVAGGVHFFIVIIHAIGLTGCQYHMSCCPSSAAQSHFVWLAGTVAMTGLLCYGHPNQ